MMVKRQEADAVGRRFAQYSLSDGRSPVDRKRGEIKAMTGLRGIAAIFVATYHFYPPNVIPGAVGEFVSKGYLWVDLFFVLSGFLIAMNYAHLFASGWSTRRWGDFLLRRVARVYPLYFVLIVASLAYTFVLHSQPHAGGLPPVVTLDHPVKAIAANMLMIQSWGVAVSIAGAAWSLSTEWAAYLLFPLLVATVLLGRRRAAWLATAAVGLTIAGTAALTAYDGAYHSGPLDAYDGTTMEPIFRCFAGFVLGMLTYRAAQSRRLLAWAGHDLVIGGVIILLVAGLASGIHDLLVYPLFAMLVLGLYGNDGGIGRMLACRPLYWLGLVSYSVYLLHSYLEEPRHGLAAWLRTLAPAPLAQMATFVAIYAVLLAIAGLAYYGIEEPGRRWVRRIGRRWVPPAAPNPAR